MAVSVLSLACAICAERVFALASVHRAKSNGNSRPTCQSPGHCSSSRVEQFNSHSRRSSNETALVGRQMLRLRLRPTFRSNLRPTLRLMLRPTLWPTLWPTLRDTLWATMSPRLRLTLWPTLRLTLRPSLRPKAARSRFCALQLAETNSESAMGMIFAYSRKHIASIIAFDIESDKPFHMLAPKVFQHVSQRLFQVLVHMMAHMLVHSLVRTLTNVSFEPAVDIASDMSVVTLLVSTD